MQLKIKYYLKLLLMSLSLFIVGNAFAASNDAVNILTWWGYLDSPDIAKEVKKQCNINMSHDVYYTNNEFLRRVKSNKSSYDIIIFSQTIYNLYKNQIPKNDVNLAKFSNKFNPIVRSEYIKRKFAPNVIYFMHSLSGFLWNPDIIDLSNESNIESIFTKAGNNIVVLIDDPLEILNLINRTFAGDGDKNYSNPNRLTKENFKRLIKSSTVYVANNFNQTYDQKNFAFAFGWSGDAVVYMKQAKKKFKFLMHPKLSYISSDLMAAMNDNPQTVCVANILMSKKVLDMVQANTYYFSPYGDYKSIDDPAYQAIYTEVFKKLPELQWLEPSFSYTDFEKIMQEWNEIQLDIRRN